MISTFSFYCKARRSCFAVLGYLPLAAILVGCDAPGTARLKELCETEGFPKVYQQVSAEGYYDASQECGDAIRFFAGWDYEYIECRQTRYMPLGPDRYALYRIGKVSNSSGLCDAEYSEKLNKYPGWFESIYNADKCFSLQEIQAPKSRYGLFNGAESVIEIDSIFDARIVKNSMYIQEMNSGKIVVKDNSFSLYPTPGIKLSSFQRILHCNTVTPENREVPPLNKVDAYIRPKMTNRESSHGEDRGDVSGGADS